jgi:glutathione reductase (NADPH)
VAGFDFDLFVIGGGSGGVRAARVAAEAGARVGLAEEYRYGGTCVIRGCIPKKLLVYASSFADDFEDAAGYGWTVGARTFDWRRLIAAKDAEIARLEAVYHDGLRRAGVQLCGVRARVVDPHRVRLANGAQYAAKHLLIATGARPFVPDIPGAELGITSNEMFGLEEQPRRMAVVGGGYVACEFAGIMNGLGTEVIQLYRGDQILRGFDADLRDHLAEAMRARGVVLEIQRDVAGIERVGAGLRVTADNGEAHDVDQVLFATGRNPNSEGLGLEELGVGIGANGAIAVDDWSQTAVPSIYAVGDVTDRHALTPVAIHEGHAFADTLFGGRPRPSDHRLIPTAIFTRPEAAAIGATEAEARAAGPVEIYRSVFRPLLSTLAGREERMLMKLVVAAEDRRVLGVHVVGHGAAEMIQLAAVALRMGATKDELDRTMAVHPTAAEELVTMRSPVAMAS